MGLRRLRLRHCCGVFCGLLITLIVIILKKLHVLDYSEVIVLASTGSTYSSMNKAVPVFWKSYQDLDLNKYPDDAQLQEDQGGNDAADLPVDILEDSEITKGPMPDIDLHDKYDLGRCCAAQGVPLTCRHLCGPDLGEKFLIQRIMCPPSCLPYLRRALYCLMNGQNNALCCKHHGGLTGFCLDICRGGKMRPIHDLMRDSISMQNTMDCLRKMKTFWYCGYQMSRDGNIRWDVQEWTYDRGLPKELSALLPC